MQNYLMYIDASGDDGYKFGEGSSDCYVASAFLMLESDKDHNLGILASIKKLMGAKNTDEVKYSKLRRHPRRDEIHNLLRDTKGWLYSQVIFKKNYPMSTMGAVSHTLAILSIREHFESFADVHVDMVIDRMKKPEEDGVSYLLGNHELLNDFPSHTLLFRDSKAKNFELIQLADVFSGLTRCYFEHVEEYPSAKSLINLCHLCLDKKKIRPYTKARHKHMVYDVSGAYYMKTIHRLYLNAYKVNKAPSITYLPGELIMKYAFIFCNKYWL